MTALEDGELVVATATQDVALSGFATLGAQPVSLRDLAGEYSLEPGHRLPALDPEAAERLSRLDAQYAVHERFWVRRLGAREAVEIPYREAARDGTVAGRTERLDASVPGGWEVLRAEAGAAGPGDVLAATFCGYLARLCGPDLTVGFTHSALREEIRGLEPFFAPEVPYRVEADPEAPAREAVAMLAGRLHTLKERGTYLHDVYHRYPSLAGASDEPGAGPAFDVAVAVVDDLAAYEAAPGAELTFVVDEAGARCCWIFDPAVLRPERIAAMQAQWTRFAEQLAADDAVAFGAVSLLTDDERHALLHGWNDTAADFPRDRCIHHLIEQQAEATPEAVALVCRGQELTYRTLNERANRLAWHLRKAGVGPDGLVGLYMDRSIDMVVSLLATLKAGGAYVPLDPDFPAERIAYMIEDAQIGVLLTRQALLPTLPAPEAAVVVCVDTAWPAIAREPADAPPCSAGPEHLSYVIYTSGSTGRPKGVMVEHRNVLNFFAGMDARIPHAPPGVWLAVTSLSFDISVLELLWTLARGFKVVLYDAEAERAAPAVPPTNGRHRPAEKDIDFSLFYFASDEGGDGAAEKYRLLLEGARFGDAHGFSAVWTPERHFHAFGGLYPNPAVAGAALAAVTRHIGIRAGSCVSPLHSSIRIAEEWAVVDNLSGGRVGISFAAGWQPNDFVLRPETFQNRKAIMFEQIETVQALWRGEAVSLPNGKGEAVDVRTLPRPVQPALPVWITAAGNPETFRMAGARGYNVLTHLLGQTPEELAEKIAVYRSARAEHGHDPDAGTVSLMLHTCVGEDDDRVREQVRAPMKAYLRSSIGLIKQAAWSFPTFRQQTTGEDGRFSVQHLSDEELDAVLDFSFERYYETSGLFGTVETCLKRVDRLRALGVDEIACLIDFGVDADAMLAQLPLLKAVKEQSNRAPSTAPGRPKETALPEAAALPEESVAALIARHGVTHLQCTPSMASMFAADPETLRALGRLDCMMVGGEAFPAPLADRLSEAVRGTVLNMYGPTETTIWSSTYTLNGRQDAVPIGRPIANTQLYVLDARMEPVPVGVPGELFIGGDGVTRGYLNRPELTRERFVEAALGTGRRLYRTGDLARYRADGNLEFLGRLDHQVKVRGYRIELGEIEALLLRHEAVREAVVVAREDTPGDVRLAAYVVPAGPPPDAAALRDALRATLPEYMVPASIVPMEALPLTPNRKIDRKRLPAPREAAPSPRADFVAPADARQQTIARIWQDVLDVERVGAHDHFFELGGHSLLAVVAHRRLNDALGCTLALSDLFKYPTVQALAAHVGHGEAVSAPAPEAPPPSAPAEAPAGLRVEVVRLGELEAFVEAQVHRRPPGSVMPLSVHRARAWLHNPVATAEDEVLLVAMRGDRCIGFLGVMPGLLKIGGGLKKIRFFSSFYVEPGARSTGAGVLLISRALDLGHTYATPGPAEPARVVLESEGFRALGPDHFYAVDLTRTPWPGAPWRLLRKLIGTVGTPPAGLDRRVEAARRRWARRLFRTLHARNRRAARRYAFRDVPRIDPALFERLQRDDASVRFYRDAALINWMLDHPWMTDDARQRTPDFFFDDYKPEFAYRAVEISAEGAPEPAGYAVLMQGVFHGVREVRVIDFAFQEDADLPALGLLALQHAAGFRAERLILPDAAGPLVAASGLLRRFARREARPLYCHVGPEDHAIRAALDRIELAYPDGEMAFV
ncbi:MAG: LLM class flavin-dependent oxidoreductase [Rhodothermales bacterium]|nr:LLM class flavin-dependent oxidoreductase [Rhodothermales bacterium]